MSNLPALIPNQAPARLELNDHEIQLVKQTVLAGQSVTDVEFQVFIRAAEHLGLDPLMKQVYGIKRKGKLTIQVGIDGFRLVADRSGVYCGNDRPVYGPKNEQGWPEWAEVTVRKMVGGVEREFVGLAYWDEFYPGAGDVGMMWRKMPFKMLGKCAEAEALRKAFPANLAGVYTPDEMAQSGQDDPLGAYRRDLFGRYRALPDHYKEKLRQIGDPRHAEQSDLTRFEEELVRCETAAQAEQDDTVVDGELVDDGPAEGPYPADDHNDDPDAARQSDYLTERAAKLRRKAAESQKWAAINDKPKPGDLAPVGADA